MLFVSSAAPPKGSPESLQVGKYLKYLIGHPLNIHLVTEKLPKRNFGWRTKEVKYTGVLDLLAQIIKVPVYYHRYFHALVNRISPRVLPRLDNEFMFTFGTRRVQAELAELPDIIYSRSTPFSSAALALKLKKKYRVPWVMHLSDPWVMSPFFSEKGSVLKYHQNMEEECFKHADKITLTSAEQIKVYKERYPGYQSKFQWFPNVFDDEEVVTGQPYLSSSISFLHTGNFYGPGRSPYPLLKALESISNDKPEFLNNVSFLFAGFHEPSIDKLLSSYKSVGVKHLGVHNLQEIYVLQKQSAVLMVIDWQLTRSQAMFLLSKTVDYMAARKPILAITTPGSTLYKLIQGVYGQCFAHDDIEGISNYIVNLINQLRNPATSQESYEVNQDYSAAYQAQRLYKLLAGTAKVNLKASSK